MEPCTSVLNCRATELVSLQLAHAAQNPELGPLMTLAELASAWEAEVQKPLKDLIQAETEKSEATGSKLQPVKVMQNFMNYWRQSKQIDYQPRSSGFYRVLSGKNAEEGCNCACGTHLVLTVAEAMGLIKSGEVGIGTNQDHTWAVFLPVGHVNLPVTQRKIGYLDTAVSLSQSCKAKVKPPAADPRLGQAPHKFDVSLGEGGVYG